MNKTYHYSRSNYLIAVILLFLALILPIGILTAGNSLPGLFFAAIPGVMGVLLVYQAALIWQVDEDQIVWRDILGRETCIRWADLQQIRNKSNGVVRFVRLESFDDARIDVFANLPGSSEIIAFACHKRADLCRIQLDQEVKVFGSTILGVISTFVITGFFVFIISHFEYSVGILLGIFFIFLLAMQLFSLFTSPYGYRLESGVLHVRYLLRDDLLFKPADVSNIQIIYTYIRLTATAAMVTVHTRDGRTIRLPEGGTYLYDVLKAWKDAG